MDMYNMTYDELKKKIVQEWKKHFPYDLASPTFIRGRLIMIGNRRNPSAIFAANLAFTGAKESNINYLMAENKQLAKKLQTTRQ